MKSLLFTCVLFLSFVFSAASQNTKNFDYLKDMSLQRSSSKISEFQNMIASYNIQNLAVFKSDKKTTYDVVFKETNCHVETTYDASGKIVSSFENYNNIKLKNKFYRDQSEVENDGVSFDSTDPVINENDKKLKVLRLKTTNI